MANTLFPDTLIAKPFLKWAGGKTQLIPAIEAVLPPDFSNKQNMTYIEPFIGSGALMFRFLQKYPNIKTAIINDINSDVTNAYLTIKEQPQNLVNELQKLQAKYNGLGTEDDRLEYFLENRELFNSRSVSILNSTALLIFLNRTCFNGLYRVNGKNKFNVPFGRYTNPKICDAETILADSEVLSRVTILNGDYAETVKYASEETFFYFDPPYKPISKTSSFNSYAKEIFDDAEQIRLKIITDTITEKGNYWLLSNSDPKNTNPDDNFFDELYSSPSNYITRVKAKRMINSNSSKRGEINELLIYNYNI